MRKKKHGFFWHVHHDSLVEWCYDYNKRATYINREKPGNEREIRLDLFKPVKGSLPRKIVKTGLACDKARRACDKAKQACDEAWQTYFEAVAKNISAVKALHKKECPNCPWNGRTIFP